LYLLWRCFLSLPLIAGISNVALSMGAPVFESELSVRYYDIYPTAIHRTAIHRTTIYRTTINRTTVSRTDSLSNRQFIEPTVYRTDGLSNRQFIEPTVHRREIYRTTVYRTDSFANDSLLQRTTVYETDSLSKRLIWFNCHKTLLRRAVTTLPCTAAVRGATSSSFWGVAIFMNSHSMTSSCLFNRGKTFSHSVTDMFFSQHFRKWELISLNQARN